MLIDKIKNLFFGKNGDNEWNSISNQQIVEKIEKVFTEIVKRDSVYDRMIFDTDFLILVTPATYELVSLQAPALAKPIISKFYEVIRKQSARYKDYTPLANYWNLQFAQKEFGSDIPRNEQIIIISKVTAERDWSETLKSDGAAEKISINGKHSKYSNWDINDEILQKIDIVERGKVRVRFNKNLHFEDIKPPQEKTPAGSIVTPSTTPGSKSSSAVTHQEGLAQIKFRENDKNMNYTMRENLISIGKAAGNEKSTLKKLVIHNNENGFEENHLQIRYDAATRIFYIAVFAPTRVNEHSIQISPITNPVWHTLTQNASILCGFYSIKFQALK